MTPVIEHKEVEILAIEKVDVFTIKIRSDGIVHSHTSAEREFTIQSLKDFTEVMGRMINYGKAPLLLTLDEFAIPPVDTRVFWAKKESCPYASAEAYLTTNTGHKIIGNFYLRFNKPGRPTKIFTNEAEAIKWLKTFL